MGHNIISIQIDSNPKLVEKAKIAFENNDILELDNLYNEILKHNNDFINNKIKSYTDINHEIWFPISFAISADHELDDIIKKIFAIKTNKKTD